MRKLMLGAAALALVTACNGADKSTSLSGSGGIKIDVRAGDPAQADAALAAMALDASETGLLSFTESSMDGASATFSNVKLSGEEDLSVGALKLEGLDMTNDQANFGKLSLEQIRVTGYEENGLVIDKIELINPSPELAAWIAGTLSGSAVDFPASHQLRFDSISLGALSANISDSDFEGTLGIDKIEILKKGAAKAARAELSGLSLNGTAEDDQNLTVGLGRFVMTNIDMKFANVIQDNIDDPEDMIVDIMSLVSENPMESGYDAIQLDDLNFDVAGAAFALPSMTAYVERNDSGVPVKYVTEPMTMSLSANAEGGEAGAGLLQGLSILGYESLEMEIGSYVDYDPESDILNMAPKKNYFGVKDGGRISFGGKLEGYSAYSKAAATAFDIEELMDGYEPDPDSMQAAFSALTVHNLEFSISDESLMDRIFNAAATSQGSDPTELKQQIGMGLAMAPMLAQGAGVDMALVTEASGALSKFINEGGELTIKLAPAQPLSLGSLMDDPDPAMFSKQKLGFAMTQK